MKYEESKSGNIADSTVDKGRRSAIRKIAVGVGVLAGVSILPEKWTRPIIGQITLPAHAQTSGSLDPGYYLASTGIVINSKGFLDTLGNFLVADAVAAPILVFVAYNFEICVTGNGSVTFLSDVAIDTTTGGGLWSPGGLSGSLLSGVTSGVPYDHSPAAGDWTFTLTFQIISAKGLNATLTLFDNGVFQSTTTITFQYQSASCSG
ncbi:MAG: hypothetical protein OEL83_04320 [Desulforhopalus sp.]|nr:hypothetical protein [Desulforhopalus sp.]